MTGTAAAGTALAIYLVGLLTAFGLQSWRQWRATGSTGFRGISGPAGSLAWWGGVSFVLALALGVAAPAVVVAGAVEPLVEQAWLGAVGLVLAVAGTVLTLVAQVAMGTSWRIGVDDTETLDLVRTGVFAYVRNPIFTGMVAVQAGVLFLVPTVLAVLALAGLVTAVQIQVRVTEEPYLARLHGDTYRVYVERTGRFLPRMRRRTHQPRT